MIHTIWDQSWLVIDFFNECACVTRSWALGACGLCDYGRGLILDWLRIIWCGILSGYGCVSRLLSGGRDLVITELHCITCWRVNTTCPVPKRRAPSSASFFFFTCYLYIDLAPKFCSDGKLILICAIPHVSCKILGSAAITLPSELVGIR